MKISLTVIVTSLLLAAPAFAQSEYTYHRTDPTADFDDIFVAVASMPDGSTLKMLDYASGWDYEEFAPILTIDKTLTFIAEPLLGAGFYQMILDCTAGQQTFVDMRILGAEGSDYLISGQGLRFESCYLDGGIHTLATIKGSAHLVDSTLVEGPEDGYDTAVIDGDVTAHRCTVEGTVHGRLTVSPECQLRIENDSDSGSVVYLYGPLLSLSALRVGQRASLDLKGKAYGFGVVLLGFDPSFQGAWVRGCRMNFNGDWGRSFDVPPDLEGLSVYARAFGAGYDDPSGLDFSLIR